ncbi:MAG: two-component system response regulator [Arcobacter sp.]|nr:MAG: two-component system response regulator [Arcobacter sp.]
MEIENLKAVYIDDEPVNLMLVQAYGMEFNLNIKTFEDSEEGLDYILNNDIDIVYTDYMMPKIDGIELIKKFRELNQEIPVVVITAIGDDQELKINALEVGATDFLTKPIDMTEFKARSLNLLTLRNAQLKLKDRALLLEDEVKKATSEIQKREHESLMVLGRAAEYKDAETANHTMRVAHYSKLLAKYYGLDENYQEIIFYASPFHDIGKVGIADGILLKEGRLTEDEFTIMKKHVNIGGEILKDTKSPYLIEGALIALNHHEKYDGSGYPNGLKADNIPLCARIVAIADVFDALTSKRPYKNSWSIQEAIVLLMKEKNVHFDPKLIDIFIEHIDEVKEIYNDFQ